MTNASTAAIERSCANRPHGGIGPWNAALPIPTPITVTAYTAGAVRGPARPPARTPGSTGYWRAARAAPDRCARSPSRPRRLRRSLLLGRVDADAVREREAAAHRLGRLRLAVDETDSAYRALRARTDALARDRDPDVGVVERSARPDAEAERRRAGD